MHTGQTDTEFMSQADFYSAGSSIYYRASEPLGVYLIRLDLETLAAIEHGDADGDLTHREARELDEAVQIAAVGASAIEQTHARPLNVGAMNGTARAWLMACADAIEEAEGVPDEVMPPIPATDA